MRLIGPLLVLGVLVVLGLQYGFLRTLGAAVMFLVLALLGMRYVNRMVSVPPDPEVTDVSEYGLKYVCGMCGLELRVEVAARDKAPSHCMEPMELVRTGGKPPLRPV